MALKTIPLNLIPKGPDRALWTIVSESISAALPPGGKKGQMLVKASDADYDVMWVDAGQTGADLDVDFGTYSNPLEGPYTGVGAASNTDFGSSYSEGEQLPNLDFGTFSNALAGVLGVPASDPRISTLISLMQSLVK